MQAESLRSFDLCNATTKRRLQVLPIVSKRPLKYWEKSLRNGFYPRDSVEYPMQEGTPTPPTKKRNIYERFLTTANCNVYKQVDKHNFRLAF